MLAVNDRCALCFLSKILKIKYCRPPTFVEKGDKPAVAVGIELGIQYTSRCQRRAAHAVYVKMPAKYSNITLFHARTRTALCLQWYNFTDTP